MAGKSGHYDKLYNISPLSCVAVELKRELEEGTAGINFPEAVIAEDIPEAAVEEIITIINVPLNNLDCNVCGQLFVEREDLQVHEALHKEDKSHICLVCKSEFADKAALLVHQNEHLVDKPYECQYCNARFSLGGNCKAHEMLHLNEKPFVCSFMGCAKAFAQKSNLKAHERIHMKIKPFKCDICSAAFAQKSNMVAHKRLHTASKPFTCGDCGKAFAQASNLKTHEMQHLPIKPYECPLCLKEFIHKRSLSFHVTRHIEADIEERQAQPNILRGKQKQLIKPIMHFKCVICLKTFPDKTSLTSHILEHVNKRTFDGFYLSTKKKK